MLLEHPPLSIARFDTMDMKPKGDAKEARGSKSLKAYTWTRRKKRRDEETAAGAAGPSGPIRRTIRHRQTGPEHSGRSLAALGYSPDYRRLETDRPEPGGDA